MNVFISEAASNIETSPENIVFDVLGNCLDFLAFLDSQVMIMCIIPPDNTNRHYKLDPDHFTMCRASGFCSGIVFFIMHAPHWGAMCIFCHASLGLPGIGNLEKY